MATNLSTGLGHSAGVGELWLAAVILFLRIGGNAEAYPAMLCMGFHILSNFQAGCPLQLYENGADRRSHKKNMKHFVQFLLLAGLGLFWTAGNVVLAFGAEEIPFSWGQSMQEVIKNQQIDSYMDADSKSLLSGLAVHALMTKGTFLGSSCRMHYSFRQDRLIEYCIVIEEPSDKRLEHIYDAVKNSLYSAYAPYNGTYFEGIDDRFADAQLKTCVLLIRDKQLIVYFVEFGTYAAAMRAQAFRDMEDLKRLVIQ